MAKKKQSPDIIILAGGGGTRLWPLSTKQRPKQFLPLPQQETLIGQAVKRAKKLTSSDRIWICTIGDQKKATEKALPGFPKKQIIAEPIGRNSGPAAALATFLIARKRNAPTTVLLQTADHFISKDSVFLDSMRKGIRRADQGKSLITFGLKVKSPRTDFGYIESKKNAVTQGVFPVKQFAEKPPLEKAKKYKKTGRHFWNSGMFCWRTDVFEKEMKRLAPKIHKPLASLTLGELSGSKKLKTVYKQLPNISIDYALMEKSEVVEVVPSNFPWSDLGTWGAVFEARATSEKDNVVIGKGKTTEAKGNLIYSKEKPVYVFGADNLVIVETKEATLVTTKENSRKLKEYRAKANV